jgi:AraC-like DNA-binding protein
VSRRVRAKNADRYFLDPFSQFCLGRCFVAAAFAPDIFCLIGWGKIERADFQELSRLLGSPELCRHPRRRQFVCHEAIEGASTSALLGFFEFVRTHPHYQTGVAREAVSRSSGLVGMIAEGFYRTTPLPFPARAFQSRDEALEWLAPDVAPGPVLDELQRLTGLYRSTTEPVLGLVRSLIVQLNFRCDLHEVARRAGISARTLQRRLQVSGTHFEAELSSLRMKAARDRLGELRPPVKAIAADLGYASTSAFVAAFKRAEGQTPEEWRAQNAHAQTTAGELLD